MFGRVRKEELGYRPAKYIPCFSASLEVARRVSLFSISKKDIR